MTSSSITASCTLLDDDCNCLKGFNISFSWDYPDNWCLKDVHETVFHLLDAKDDSKPDKETMISHVQSAGSGVILTKPNPERDVISCELSIKAHPASVEFCITDILVISEARHIELYINDMYDKTCKGSVLSIKKGNKPTIFECQLDLSNHVQGSQKVTLKFLSLGDKESLRLQGIVLTIVQCVGSTPIPKKAAVSADVNVVREMIKSMNLEVSDGADKLMKDIECQQRKNQLMFQNMMLGGNVNPQQLYQLTQNIIPTNVGATQNVHVNQQADLTQNLLPSQFEALKYLLPSQPGIPALKNVPMSSHNMQNNNLSNQHLQPGCCYPGLQQQQQQQQQQFIRDNIHDDISSKSKSPNSQNRSPQLTHCHLHLNGGHINNVENSPVPPGSHILGRSTCNSPVHSIDNNCFSGTNPPNESVLANAILNEPLSKEITRSRLSLIEQQNLHAAHMKMNDSYCKSENSLYHGGRVKLRHVDNMSRKCLDKRKRRAKSLCSMPTDSEMDFSHLITEIIKDEGKCGRHAIDLIEDDDIDSRWESYLRSRVRATRRSSESYDNVGCASVNVPGDNGINRVNLHENIHISRNKECFCSDDKKKLDELSSSLITMEHRLMTYVDAKVGDLRQHLDKRLDTLLEVINVPQILDYDESLCSNTEV